MRHLQSRRLFEWIFGLLLIASCVKEHEEKAGDYPVLKAVIPDTKTLLDGTQLKFKVGDGLSVFNGIVSTDDHNGHCKYECTSVDDQGVATFEYVDDASVNPYKPSADLQQIVATHPNRSEATSEFEPAGDGYGEGTVKVRMVAGPVSVSRTTGFSGSTVPVVACACKGEMLSFKITCGVLRLDMTGEGSISKIVVESDKAISGEASVPYASDEPVLTVTGSGKTITYTYGTGRALSDVGTPFYFGLPVGTHDLTFTFHDTEGNSMSKKASGLVIERADIVVTRLDYQPDNTVVGGGIAAMPSEEVSAGHKVKVASFNIWTPNGRVGSSGAKTDELKEILKWEKAYCAVAECIDANAPDVIGLNEVSKEAYSKASLFGSALYPCNIQSLLPSYSWILFDENGTRVTSDSPVSGIYSLSEAILYDSSKVKLEDCGYFLTGDESLYGVTVYDYAKEQDVDICNEQRHCIWARFEHVASGYLFYVFCLHNDLTYSYTDSTGNKVVDERSQCANALAVLAKAAGIVAEGMPSVILGDFNATAGDTSFEYFRDSGRWKDAYETVASREGTYITSGKAITTMNGKDNSTLSYIRPDHILSDGFKVLSYSVDRNRYESADGTSIYPSDHFLIKSTLSF